MRLLGAKSVNDLGPRFVSLNQLYQCCLQCHTDICYQVNTRMVERDIYDGEPNLDRSGLWEKQAAVAKSKL